MRKENQVSIETLFKENVQVSKSPRTPNFSQRVSRFTVVDDRYYPLSNQLTVTNWFIYTVTQQPVKGAKEKWIIKYRVNFSRLLLWVQSLAQNNFFTVQTWYYVLILQGYFLLLQQWHRKKDNLKTWMWAKCFEKFPREHL